MASCFMSDCREAERSVRINNISLDVRVLAGVGKLGGDWTHHGDHVIDLLHSQPVQHVRHQRLEPHILYPGDQLGGLEVPVGGISASFARVVDEVYVEGGPDAVYRTR